MYRKCAHWVSAAVRGPSFCRHRSRTVTIFRAFIYSNTRQLLGEVAAEEPSVYHVLQVCPLPTCSDSRAR